MFSKFFSSKSDDKTSNQANQGSANNDLVSKIIQLLTAYRCEVFPQGVLPLCSLEQVNLVADGAEVVLVTPFPCTLALEPVAHYLCEALGKNIAIEQVLDINAVRAHNIKGVKNIIAVASGKGGVGKSTTAVNLAYTLQAEGASVGLLDADIYGPSIPTLLGKKSAKPSSEDGKTMLPIESNGVVAMSIGFLVDEADATVWRGPMASRAFGQLLNETSWPDLDYLIVDMPPGTGDIQLTLAQSVPVAAAVVVTTPQDIALIDAIKGVAMFDKVQVPVLGVIENMSYHVCDNCGHQSHLFGQGGANQLATEHNTQLLGQLPLNINIRQSGDDGISLIDEDSSSELALAYRKIAQNVANSLFQQMDMRSEQTAKLTTSDE